MALTAQQLDQFLRSRRSPLAGQGAAFLQAGSRYRVDPRLLVGIAGAESSFGTAGSGRDIHNPFGWGPAIPFGSYEEAINTVARGLRQGYLNKGLKNVGQISQKYAPVGAANDPTGLNKQWSGNVASIMRQLGASPETLDYAKNVAALELGQDKIEQGAHHPGPQTVAERAHELMTPVGRPISAVVNDFVRQSRQEEPTLVQQISRVSSTAAKILNDIEPLVMPFAKRDTSDKTGTLKPPKDQNGNLPGTHEGADPVVSKALQFAHNQVGQRYVWGGESRKEGGFDCSGLIDAAYRAAGIDLPGRLTSQSARTLGKAVPNEKNLQPGDILVTHGGNHVVMYVGHGKVIAARSSHLPLAQQIMYQPMSVIRDEGIVAMRRIKGAGRRIS